METSTKPGARPLQDVVAHLNDLPAMPQAVAEVLRLMNDGSADAQEVGAAIESDPAMAAKILRLANSAYYGLKRQVGSVRLALVVLGMREVRNMVLGMSAFDTARANLTGDPLIRDMWAHSLKVAALSKKLATELRLGLQGEDFVGGLLHDVGKAVLLSQFGAEYRRLWEKDSGEALIKVERAHYGCSHAEVGAALLQHWALPEALVGALWYHHASDELPLQDAKNPPLAAVVRLADLAAHDDMASGLETSTAYREEEAWLQFIPALGMTRPERRYSMLAAFKREIQELPVPSFV